MCAARRRPSISDRLFVEPPVRSRVARTAALLSIVRHYGQQPEFVVLGELVPELRCSALQRAGTTGVDVQLDPEIACGVAMRSGSRERSVLPGSSPKGRRPWRWGADGCFGVVIV